MRSAKPPPPPSSTPSQTPFSPILPTTALHASTTSTSPGTAPDTSTPSNQSLLSAAFAIDRSRYDGSSGHSTTCLEGNGPGTGMPATQSNSIDDIQRRLTVLEILRDLYHLMGPLALSKEEFEVITFRSFDVNVFSMGGTAATGLTGLQSNVSSWWRGGDLRAFIGMLQGSYHIDVKDDPCRWTLLVMQLRLYPG